MIGRKINDHACPPMYWIGIISIRESRIRFKRNRALVRMEGWFVAVAAIDESMYEAVSKVAHTAL